MVGRQLLPVIVDERDPKRLFARVPKSPKCLNGGFIDITCGDFAKAVNRVARWIEDLLRHGLSFGTLAYIGPSDIRYSIFLLGASKVGYKVSKLERFSFVQRVHLTQVNICEDTSAISLQQYQGPIISLQGNRLQGNINSPRIHSLTSFTRKERSSPLFRTRTP